MVEAERFRERLRQVLERSGSSLTEFASRVGIDRSTLSQILSPSTTRLPRVDTLIAIAAAEQVSIDWLVGLTESGGLAPDILPLTVEITQGGLTPVDEQLNAWRGEALGYKIRYVPATLPDILKTEAVIQYEFGQASMFTPEQRQASYEHRLEYQRRPETDTEVCSMIQSITSFVRGEHIWADLPTRVRREQLEHAINLIGELYPTFRWFLFDGMERYSVPLTVFGPLRAVIYLGQRYLVITSRELIQSLTAHFDGLIRHAVVEPTAITSKLAEILDEM